VDDNGFTHVGFGAMPTQTWMISDLGTRAHLSTSGVEFDEKLFRVGPDCALRMAASVDFPREFPLPQGESLKQGYLLPDCVP